MMVEINQMMKVGRDGMFSSLCAKRQADHRTPQSPTTLIRQLQRTSGFAVPGTLPRSPQIFSTVS
jgi:hypothetical protein